MKRWFYKGIVGLLKWPLRWIFRVRVEGVENVPTESGYILCSNHISDMDPLLLAVTTPKACIRYMAKIELFRVFGLRRLVRWLGAFPVDRGAGDTGALETAAQMIRQGDVMGIFPEGTRSKDGKLQRIKSGVGVVAAMTKADILPVCIKPVKGNRPRPFRKTVVTYGKLIPFEQLGIEDASPRGIRNAMRLITDVMKELCGENEEA